MSHLSLRLTNVTQSAKLYLLFFREIYLDYLRKSNVSQDRDLSQNLEMVYVLPPGTCEDRE